MHSLILSVIPMKKWIIQKQQTLSSLAYFIGKDYEIPVLLNEPGKGWYWDQERNHIKVDPKDLLEKPMDYLRFVVSHEAGHRRISRITGVIPQEVWQQPGFSFMFNAVEDCRDNNFVAEAYPRFREQMISAYDLIDAEQKAKTQADATLGHQPKFMQAGFEYMKQWLKEVKGEEFAIDASLPEDVRSVVGKTLADAQDSWWRYPSKEEADMGEDAITKYAKAAYDIDYEKLWPEFRTLIDQDIERQMEQEALAERGDGTEENTQQSIQEYIDGLSAAEKQELRARAEETLKEFAESISKEIAGKLVPQAGSESLQDVQSGEQSKQESAMPPEQPDTREIRQSLQEALMKDENVYEKYRNEVLDVINTLENDLREIFTLRRAHKWETGHKSGKKIDIKRRIQEKAKGVSPIQSRAWERREAPHEKDYAISLLVDLSGSMQRGEKITETFKAVIALSEVLNRLSIHTEILGFNDRLYEYQNFGDAFSRETRETMGGMLAEVENFGTSGREKASYNDDGWAVGEASNRLEGQQASEKFLIVLSDGKPEPSPAHNSENYDLVKTVQRITKETDQYIVGLGIGSDTEHVKNYYPNNLASVRVEEMASALADVILDAVAGKR